MDPGVGRTAALRLTVILGGKPHRPTGDETRGMEAGQGRWRCAEGGRPDPVGLPMMLAKRDRGCDTVPQSPERRLPSVLRGLGSPNALEDPVYDGVLGEVVGRWVIARRLREAPLGFG